MSKIAHISHRYQNQHLNLHPNITFPWKPWLHLFITGVTHIINDKSRFTLWARSEVKHFQFHVTFLPANLHILLWLVRACFVSSQAQVETIYSSAPNQFYTERFFCTDLTITSKPMQSEWALTRSLIIYRVQSDDVLIIFVLMMWRLTNLLGHDSENFIIQ